MTGAALVGSGLVGLSGPAAAAPSPAAATWAEPVAGTSAEIAFDDAPASVMASPLSPYLAEIVRDAKRVRTVDIDAAGLSPSFAAESVAIELFDDVTVDLKTTVALSKGAAISGRSSSTYSAGGDSGAAVATLIGGDMHVVLWKGTAKYGIEPLGGGRHLVFEDGRMFPNEALPVSQGGKAANAPAAAPAGSSTLATSVIDIMVAFDETAQAMFGSVAAIESEIIEMVNVSNMTYANSQIDQQLALTNIVDLGYTPNATDGTTDEQTYLSRIRGKTDGIVDNVHTQRDANSADLVSVITDATSVCGVGYLPTSGNPAELDAYSLTDGACAVSNLTFPHEVGHNMCAHHDPANVTSNPCGAQAFAHVGPAENLRTVMAYANAANGCTTCTRIPYFSNPNVTVNGWTTGIAGSRNNSAVMGARAAGIAAYRSSGPSPASCEVDYVVASTWPGNVQVNLVVENTTASPINGWTAQWTFTGNENVYNSWGVTVTKVGTAATATGTGFGATIPAGGTVTVGFQATVTGTPTVPSPITCTA
ncbi:cellulose binding domain-containing protein [Micromonospora sp. CPCC 206061]|uniref:cellulose binding domain-containing protein n=1 Tax=Micromonospora sp. CPCC 206061 TaxID=3122410 RepID=UPI002FEE9ED2